MAKNLWTEGAVGQPARAAEEISRRSRSLRRAIQSEAIERLVELMRNKKAGNLSLKACEIILDRAWGSVPYAVTGEGGRGPSKDAYEVSWRHSEDGGVTLDLKPNKDALFFRQRRLMRWRFRKRRSRSTTRRGSQFLGYHTREAAIRHPGVPSSRGQDGCDAQ